MPSMFGRKRSHSSGAGSFPPWHGTAQSLFPQLWRKKALPRRRKQRQQRRNITPHAMRATMINSMQHMAVDTQRNSTGPWYIYLLRHGVRPRHASPPKNDMEPIDVNPLKQTVGPMTVNPPDNRMETIEVNPPQEDSLMVVDAPATGVTWQDHRVSRLFCMILRQEHHRSTWPVLG